MIDEPDDDEDDDGVDGSSLVTVIRLGWVSDAGVRRDEQISHNSAHSGL